MDARRRALARLRPYAERALSFAGSEFSVDARSLGPPLPWEYAQVVREHAGGCSAALDMGTGGGERLAELRPDLPQRLVATEEWDVNVPVAARRLQPLGVGVVRCRSLRLPFAPGSFDLVTSRHEELDPGEVARVLSPGGCVVTQQVGRDDWREVGEFFPRVRDFGDLRAEYARGFAAAGLEVFDDRAHEYRVALGSLGDLVYMLGVSPWLIPDFSLERDLDALLALEESCTQAAGLVLTESRFLLVASRPS